MREVVSSGVSARIGTERRSTSCSSRPAASKCRVSLSRPQAICSSCRMSDAELHRRDARATWSLGERQLRRVGYPRSEVAARCAGEIDCDRACAKWLLDTQTVQKRPTQLRCACRHPWPPALNAALRRRTCCAFPVAPASSLHISLFCSLPLARFVLAQRRCTRAHPPP